MKRTNSRKTDVIDSDLPLKTRGKETNSPLPSQSPGSAAEIAADHPILINTFIDSFDSLIGPPRRILSPGEVAN